MGSGASRKKKSSEPSNDHGATESTTKGPPPASSAAPQDDSAARTADVSCDPPALTEEASVEPLQARRRTSLLTVPLDSAPEGGKGEAQVSFVMDCGSGHTKLFTYRREGDDIREKSGRLPYVLSDLLAEGSSPMWQAFLSDVEKVGELENDPAASFFLGATGGVRRALEAGEVSQEHWAAFGDLMRSRWPTRKIFQVILTGTEEATRELVAVRTLKRPMVDRMKRGSLTFQGCSDTAPDGLHADSVGLLSGGGESCQIAWGVGSNLRVECVRLSTVEAMKRINEDETAGRAWWEQHLSELKSQTTDWPSGGLTGTFIGTSLQASIAKLSGCTDRYVLKPELLERVSSLVQDLAAPEESDVVRRIREDWESYSKEPWTKRKLINLLAAARLESMLRDLFSDEACFYFARKFEIVKGHWMDAQWTLGTFLAL